MNNTAISLIKKTAVVICLLAVSCTVKYYDTNKLLNDYKTEGFLDTDHYQVIIKGEPSKDVKGLVLKRKSALRDATEKLKQKVTDSLAGYTINYNLKKSALKTEDVLNMEESKAAISDALNEYFKYGYNAFEYYNEDASAVLVYRIFKDDLIEDIESINPEFKVRAKENEKK